MKISDMQLICDMIAEKKVIVKRNNNWTNSIARFYHNGKRTITIAEPIFNYPAEIQLAEIIHESIHHLSDSLLPHGYEFKKLETYWLKEFGLRPIAYKRAYYKILGTLDGRYIKTRNQNYDYEKESEFRELKQLAGQMRKRNKTRIIVQL